MTADLSMLVSLAALVVAAAIIGASEAALLRVSRVRIEVRALDGVRSATRLLPLLDELPMVMNTILLVVLLVQIAAATLAGTLASRHFGSLGITIASIVLTVVLFVYAESIPKTYAVHHPVRVAEATAPLIRVMSTVLRPVVALLVWFADLQAPGSGIATSMTVTEQELVYLAKDAAAAGRIDPSDLDLIQRAFVLGDLQVDEILVPRTEVVGIPATATTAEALDIATRSGHRRLPVFEGDLDTVIGMVRLRDLATAALEDPAAPATAVARPELLVPESRRVVDLLADMQSSGLHFAVVVDEHGGTEGIVTIEDVVAELVGDIADPEKGRLPRIFSSGQGRWRADAAIDVADLEAATGADLPDGDWNTLGGLLIAQAGRILERGDVIEIGDLRFRVVDAEPQRIVTVEVSETS